tara:strand:+ start:4031 stop:4246 length:216 start_codon:yes stop_codon:yes gene_type:complete
MTDLEQRLTERLRRRDAEVERLKYRVDLLQHVIDIRPAKNAGLVAAYDVWTDSIYARELNEAIPAREQDNG